MIYLDNAATTYPKPPAVRAAVDRALARFGANPGRGGYRMSIETAEAVYGARREAALLFGAPGPECVAFPLNCTQALNFVIKGALKPGGHVVVSNLEHNAVMRPLETLRRRGICSYTKAQVFPGDAERTLQSFREALNEKTCLCVCTHMSNVWGTILPVARIAALCHIYGVPVCVDCAQSAGVLPLSIREDGIDFLCAAGHKGLYGPMGTGLLLARDGAALDTVVEGGTGTQSLSLSQPREMPEHLESGTVNVPGIVGLSAGIAFVRKLGPAKIFAHEHALVLRLYRGLQRLPVTLYTGAPEGTLLSWNAPGVLPEEAAAFLSRAGFAVRAGLHCAPCAHEAFGTLPEGCVRVSPGAFTTAQQIDAFLSAVERLCAKKHVSKNQETPLHPKGDMIQ